jgi:DNA-directed RNA polymerase I, II, and III subunit RPABC1
MDLDAFAIQYPKAEDLKAVFQHADPSMPAIRTRFDIGLVTGKFATPELRTVCEEADRDCYKRIVVVVRDGTVAPGTRKTVGRMAAAGRYRIELFEHREVMINITEHDLVPKHEPMAADDKRQLLEHYCVKDSQLPQMKVSDPVARYFGVDAGTVMKITRKSETAGRYVTYRLVV